jgi:hypothetical protein
MELSEIEKIQDEVRQAGKYLLRMTEWHDGFQVAAFNRTDVRQGHVTAWYATEYEAWHALRATMIEKGLLFDPSWGVRP